MRLHLLGGNAQVTAIKIDRSASDLLDERPRDAPRQMLAPHLVNLPRKALAQLLRYRRDRIEEPHDTPQIITLFDQLQRTAPTIKPHELRDRNAVAERKRRDHETAQVDACPFDHGQRFRQRKLQQRIGALRMQALGHHLDGLPAKAQNGIATGHAFGGHLRGEPHHVVPGLRLAWCPAGVAWIGIGVVRCRRRGDGIDQLLLQMVDGDDENAHPDGPMQNVAMLPKPEASERQQACRRQQQGHDQHGPAWILRAWLARGHGLLAVALVPMARALAS